MVIDAPLLYFFKDMHIFICLWRTIQNGAVPVIDSASPAVKGNRYGEAEDDEFL